MTTLKISNCLCGGDVDIRKQSYTYGMDGGYKNWEIHCKKNAAGAGSGLLIIFTAENHIHKKK